MSEITYAIVTNQIAKKYKEGVTAVDQINLKIPRNKIFALLGPNGAGKTTMLSMLTTLTRPTSGSATVLGLDIEKKADSVRKRIGVTFQETVLDLELTGRQILDFHGKLYQIGTTTRKRQIKELLKLGELEDAADRRVKTYSGGMKRRLELIRGLMTDPEILFLDEPTLGLDPQSRANMWEHIKKLKDEKGITILLTTHYLEEAESLADEVIIIDQGKIVVQGSPQELIKKMGNNIIRLTGEGNSKKFQEALKKKDFIDNVVEKNGIIQIGVDSGDDRLITVITLAVTNSYTIKQASVVKPNLGEVFLSYTGRKLRD